MQPSLDRTDLETLVQSINKKWTECRTVVEEQSRCLDKNYLIRKAVEELATLLDVHEGYQRYINSAEKIVPGRMSDTQKLDTQIETNKVKLKGKSSMLKLKNHII